MYLNAKNSLQTTRISSFEYVFIVFLKKADAKIHIISPVPISKNDKLFKVKNTQLSIPLSF